MSRRAASVIPSPLVPFHRSLNGLRGKSENLSCQFMPTPDCVAVTKMRYVALLWGKRGIEKYIRTDMSVRHFIEPTAIPSRGRNQAFQELTL